MPCRRGSGTNLIPKVAGHESSMDAAMDNCAIPDARYRVMTTRVRALKIYQRHTQKNAIAFVDHIVAKFPFRIQQIRTDRGHEFQAQFHWHVEDLGIRHAYIKARTPQLNGKVERSHRSDQEEFYQLLSYKGDVDLHKKLDEWEHILLDLIWPANQEIISIFALCNAD